MRTSFIAVVAGVALGSALAPTGFAEHSVAKSKLGEIMERHDRLVQLSDPNCQKPPLFLIHGATDDPTEMMAIAREWKNEYNIFLYSYNYHKRVEKIAADFVNELRRVKASGRLVGDATVIAFSYGAIVFREAVIQSPDSNLFAGDRLIQIAPPAGGSYFARAMENRLASFVISMASKPAAAANPYGAFAKHVWEDGNEKFYSVIDSQRMQTILVEGDANSVSRIQDETIQRRYKNGIGENVVMVPRSAGISHEYFPVEPAGLEYLRKAMESPNMRANPEKTVRGDLHSRETLSWLRE